MTDKYETTQSRTRRNFVLQRMTAEFMLKKAKEQEFGQEFFIRAGLIFCSFCIESYCNHLLQEEFNILDETERLGTKEKILLLIKMMKVDIKKSETPLQTILQNLKIRNMLVHTETKTIKDTKKMSHRKEPTENIVLFKEEEFLTINFLETSLESTKNIMTSMHNKLGRDSSELRSYENMWSVQRPGSLD